jgi:lysophospholipase L1-like esterase
VKSKHLLAAGITVVVAIAFVVALVRINSPGSPATPRDHTRVVAASTVLYLDVGASVSVGVQPTPRHPKGQPTDRGYSNRLVTLEAAQGVTLKLRELGCPGESIATMIHGPDPCYVAPDTQLSDAVTFLRVHHSATTLVTVDLGFNTLDVCLRHRDIDLTCVSPKLALLRSQLNYVMGDLTRAAGPHVVFIGVGHYNPYLSLSTKEGSTETFATNSVAALRQMNRSLAEVYASFKVPMADVATAFHEEDLRRVRIPHREVTTVNVQYECKYTWMCAPKPYGPNIHPSDAGYEAIANAIAVVLPANL